MLRLIEAGVLNKVMSDVIHSTSTRTPYTRPKFRVDEPLTLSQLQSIAYLLLAGLVLGIVAFIAELKMH